MGPSEPSGTSSSWKAEAVGRPSRSAGSTQGTKAGDAARGEYCMWERGDAVGTRPDRMGPGDDRLGGPDGRGMRVSRGDYQARRET